MKKFSFYFSFLFFFFGTIYSQKKSHEFVNPMIGTGGHGHTFPGAIVPFGGVQVSPDTRNDDSWDGCSGYHFSDSIIYGFSHTHLSGTGCSDYGDILLMPSSSEVSLENYAYKKPFSHKNEIAKAGYYSISFPQDKMQVELTPTAHGAIHRYNFPNKYNEIFVVIDLAHRDKLLDSKMEQIDDYTLRGYRFSKAWAVNQKVFFEIKFDRPIEKIKYENSFSKDEKANHFLIYFKNTNSKKSPNTFLKTKVAISGVDEEGAHKNLEMELKSWDFEKYKNEAELLWDKELSKIQIESNTSKQDTIFYTALYHVMTHPSLYSDVDGRYRGRDDKIHNTEGKFNYYTVFSLWDTYRALHPLLTIIDKQRTNDFIQTFLREYTEGGRLPMWELYSNETDCMIGYHAVSVIWDAYSKGIRNYDANLALEAMISIANENKYGKWQYIKNGYLSVEDEGENVSKTLEYSYDDWCIASMAKELGRDSIAQVFSNRSLNARNLFDWKAGFYAPRKNGNFIKDFKPNEINNYFTEGNAWQYMRGNHLIDILYYQKNNIKVVSVDSLFTTKDKCIGREQSDVTGLIGQYAHGNEPSHHLAYLIQNDSLKTFVLHHIMNDFYTNAPDGLVGNEDCGQMSAWYVWSALGLYPTIPGSGMYATSNPFFKSAKIFTDKNTFFIIDKNPNSPLNPLGNYINHLTLETNGFHFTENDNKIKNIETILNSPILLPPVILAAGNTFKDSMMVNIESTNDKIIVYKINNSPFNIYKKPFWIYSNSTIEAYTTSSDINEESIHSYSSTATFKKKENDYKVILNSTYSPQYHAEGPQGLVDGILGSLSWRAGNWMGVQGEEFEAEIDLNKIEKINSISPEFLQDQGAWIFFPASVEVSVSKDGKEFHGIGIQKYKFSSIEEEDSIKDFEFNCNEEIRYIKVHATQYGKLPDWHPGKGGESYIFIDEIKVIK